MLFIHFYLGVCHEEIVSASAYVFLFYFPSAVRLSSDKY